jgi:DNA-binding NtrC family response regulator
MLDRYTRFGANRVMGAGILIAEDDAQLRRHLAGFLVGKGLRVLEAADGEQAYDVLTAKPDISLLLSGVKMPGMTGYELVEKALELRPEIKVLMMTAYAADHPPPAALKAREIRTLVKPFEPERVAALVLDMLARP